jgi:hypothetical protein
MSGPRQSVIVNTTSWRAPFGLLYSWAAFGGTWVFFSAFVVFLSNAPDRAAPWLTPSVDTGPSAGPILAVVVDVLLIGLFGLQHRSWRARS